MNYTRVVIFSEALERIKKESISCVTETGGILIGFRGNLGSIFITYATPPGPKAIQSPLMFRRDTVFQQKILDALHEQYGVNYVGEWHKHPREVIQPSSGDIHTALDILNDPDYGIKSLILCITIPIENNDVQIVPYYINLMGHFTPIEWEVIQFSICHDQTLMEIISHTDDTVNSAQKVSSVSSNKSCVISKDFAQFEKTLDRNPLRCGKLSYQNVFDKMLQKITFFLKKHHILVPRRTELAMLWYQTECGKKKLAKEKHLLDSLSIPYEVSILLDKRLCFIVKVSEIKEIVIIYPDDFPASFPEITEKVEGELQPVNISRFSQEVNRLFLKDILKGILKQKP